MAISAAALLCLSAALHYEARGEGLEGKQAVASVILNRVESPRFPNTICGVVKQPRQFSWYPKRGLTYGKQKKFARKFLQGQHKRILPGAYFFTNKTVRLRRPLLRVLGNHRFYGM